MAKIYSHLQNVQTSNRVFAAWNSKHQGRCGGRLVNALDRVRGSTDLQTIRIFHCRWWWQMLWSRGTLQRLEFVSLLFVSFIFLNKIFLDKWRMYFKLIREQLLKECLQHIKRTEEMTQLNSFNTIIISIIIINISNLLQNFPEEKNYPNSNSKCISITDRIS